MHSTGNQHAECGELGEKKKSIHNFMLVICISLACGDLL